MILFGVRQHYFYFLSKANIYAVVKFMITTNRASKYNSSFISDFLASPSVGMTTLAVKKTANNKIAPLRCDYSINILTEHAVDNHIYPTWEKTIAAQNANKNELFYTPNTFYGKRNVDNLCSLRAFYLDIDCHSKDDFSLSAVDYLKDYLTDAFGLDDIPVPTFIFSGRGIHLIWKIGSIGPNRLHYWNAVQTALAQHVDTLLENSYLSGIWSVDMNSLDAARILRLPGSYNHKAESWCKILSYTSEESKLSYFTDFFDIGRHFREKTYDLSPVTRYDGLIRVGDLRGWEMDGYRNTFLTILASDIIMAGASESEVNELLGNINARFPRPLSYTQIRAIAKCTATHGYRYSYKGIVERLGLSHIEQESLGHSMYKYEPRISVINGYAKCSATGVDTRIRGRHSKEDAVKKKIQKVEKYIHMTQLREQGYSCFDIAEMLKVSLRTVITYWKMSPSDIEKKFFSNGMPTTAGDVCEFVEKKYGKKTTANTAEACEAMPDYSKSAEAGTISDIKCWINANINTIASLGNDLQENEPCESFAHAESTGSRYDGNCKNTMVQKHERYYSIPHPACRLSPYSAFASLADTAGVSDYDAEAG